MPHKWALTTGTYKENPCDGELRTYRTQSGQVKIYLRV